MEKILATEARLEEKKGLIEDFLSSDVWKSVRQLIVTDNITDPAMLDKIKDGEVLEKQPIVNFVSEFKILTDYTNFSVMNFYVVISFKDSHNDKKVFLNINFGDTIYVDENRLICFSTKDEILKGYRSIFIIKKRKGRKTKNH